VQKKLQFSCSLECSYFHFCENIQLYVYVFVADSVRYSNTTAKSGRHRSKDRTV